MEQNKRHAKLRENIKKRMTREMDSAIRSLKERDDYIPEIEPFINAAVLSCQPEKIESSATHLIGLLCVQTPFELLDAFGVTAYKLCGGSYAAQHFSTPHLPALACPMIKSTMGILKSLDENRIHFDKLLVPTTCDWVLKFAEIAELDADRVHFMELPRVKETERGDTRWLEELYKLKKLFEEMTGGRLKRGDLLNSMRKYQRAWSLFVELVELKRDKKISPQFFTLISNAFPFMRIEVWTERLEAVVAEYSKSQYGDRGSGMVEVYLAGAPVVFPNMKLLDILEEVGILATADDLCSSERIFPGGTCCADSSMSGLMKTLAHRYDKACICPTYANNDRRLNTILNVVKKYNIKGVVHHVLKGCHPYDIESLTVESKLKRYGCRFIKIETDYVEEDRQTILNRLEAFRNTLV